MSAIDFSSDVGLVACFLLSGNLLLGLLLAFRYNPWTHWPHRRFNYFTLHNWTAYVALAASVLHPILVLFVKDPGFRVIDVLVPIHSPLQPAVNTLGALSLYALIVVVTTSYARHRMTRATWKMIHFTAYLCAPLFFVHGILSDQTLTGHPVDIFDGEKVAIEACLVLLLGLAMWRLRRARTHRRRGEPARAVPAR
ncbi:MAG TPA: ferric reductase-like transmembrane domain-containing protein [Gemmatimonadales bacterium]